MKRAVFAILAVLSALLTLAAAAAWVMSYARPTEGHLLRAWRSGEAYLDVRTTEVLAGRPDHLDSVEWGAWWLRSRSGNVTIVRQEAIIGESMTLSTGIPTYVIVAGDHRGVDAWIDDSVPPADIWERLGFRHERMINHRGYRNRPSTSTARIEAWTAPYWLFVLIGLPLPLLWLRANRRSRRWARQGRCTRCGYDLRASPDRCPECGQPSPGSTAASAAPMEGPPARPFGPSA